MASLRFKTKVIDGKESKVPFVDFRFRGKRYRPEFEDVKSAMKFEALANQDPESAYQLYDESRGNDTPTSSGEQSSLLLIDEVRNFLRYAEDQDSFKNTFKHVLMMLNFFGYSRADIEERLFYPLDETSGKELVQASEVYLLSRSQLDIRLVTFPKWVSASQRPKIYLQNITTDDIEKLQKALLKEAKLKQSSVNRYFATVRRFFARCVETDKLDKTPCRSTKDHVMRWKRKREEDFWDDSVCKKMDIHLAQVGAEDCLRLANFTMSQTAFGPTDMSRLTWETHDFANDLIHTFRKKGAGVEEWEVIMTPEYKARMLALREERFALGLAKPSDFIFLRRSLEPMDPQWMSNSFRRYRKQLGIPVVPYGSRAFIVTKIGRKLGIVAASKAAGHSNTRTTERHYYADEEGAEQRAKVQRALEEHWAPSGH